MLMKHQKQQEEKQKLEQQEQEQASREATAIAVRKAVKSDDILKQLKDAELDKLKGDMERLEKLLKEGRSVKRSS